MSSIPQYFDRLRYVRFELVSDLYAVEHSRDPESSYFFASYDQYKNRKDRLFIIMARMGQREFKREWDGHHVVEGNHLRSFFKSQTEFDKYYDTIWPVVYILNKEHHMYNALLRNRETRILHKLTRRTSKETRLENVRALYIKCYDGNPVLTAISENVLLEIKNMLPRLV